MARLPIPQQGQPLDLAYIASVATAVNELFEVVNQRGSTSASIDDPQSSIKTSLKASEVRVVGGYKEVVSRLSVSAGTTSRTFTYDFPLNFKFVPIVSATPVNIGSTDAGKNVSVTITSITTGRIEGQVNFNVTGVAGVGVHIIAIGVPT
jgi:hypothetical protein